MIDPAKHRIIVSLSGGKDSAAAALHLKEHGYDFECVFLDTGWESEATYRYLREVLPEHVGPITWARSTFELDDEREALAQELEAMLGHHSAMVRVILKKGMFPSRQRRYCTQELKVFTFMEYLAGLDTPRDQVINVVGIRHEEGTASNGRGEMSEWEFMAEYACWVWRPVIHFTFEDVAAIHRRHGLLPNAMYLDGAIRVGCHPCIYAKKPELRLLADDRKRIAVIERLEAEVGRMARERMEAKGTTLEEEGSNEPSWFQSREDTRRWKLCPVCNGSKVTTEITEPSIERYRSWPTLFVAPERKTCRNCKGRGEVRTEWAPQSKMWPIGQVMDWAKGESPDELFAARPGERGCARWGVCDVVVERDQ